MKRLLPGLALLLASVIACAAAEGPELLVNGGFEQVTAAGLPSGWTGFSTADWGDCRGQARAVPTSPYEGKYCLELSGVQEQYAAMTAAVPVAPDKAYRLRGWIRTALRRGQTAYLVAGWQSDRGWLRNTNLQAVAGATGWTLVEQVLTPASRPAGATKLQVSFRVSGTAPAGRAWLDAVSLREIDLPTAAASVQSGDRLLDMARELLIEREIWRDRLATLGQRHDDLQQLLRVGGSLASLQSRYGDAVRSHQFLTRLPSSREELERRVPTDAAAVRAQAPRLTELPDLREQCFRQLQATLPLKRQLDADPGLRRFFLWAQLAALRPGPVTPTPARSIPTTPEFKAALAHPPAGNGELLDFCVRTQPTDVGGGVATLTAALPEALPRTVLQAAIVSPQGTPVAFASLPIAGTAIALRLQIPQANLWFPDCPYVYTLHAVLLREGRPVDQFQQKIAFRDLRMVETDVTPTLRHAWGWALTDYTFCCNGQPYFPRGSVGGFNRQYPDQSTALCHELWLDFERTYGASVARLSDQQADDLAARGLTLIGSLAPDYTAIRQYVSAQSGLEDYREMANRTAWLADHPALLSLQVGNEAELAGWGADLPSSYDDDLWDAFNEVTRVVREAWQPRLPVGYVRAANFNAVLPVPREDYSGVNQYTGRYWGRRATIAADLDELALTSARENKPVAITEWNGPKYSWATRGVSGVDEEGAAQYIADYYQNMTRTPGLVLSSEFVLNWVVTPVEDLTTVPLAEGLKRRAAWKWSLQQGTPWYPSIWPDLLTDTPARRAMRGFDSPLYELTEAPGEIIVMADAPWQAEAAQLAAELRALGRVTRTLPLAGADLAAVEANVLIVGGVGDQQPAAVRQLEGLRVIGHTGADFPAAGAYLAQRRVNPWFPDHALAVLTAADPSGMKRGLTALHLAAAGLQEALARQASCRRAVALIDDNQEIAKAFSRYVMELPARGFLLGRDDLRTVLQADEFLTPQGALKAQWSDLAALVIAARRPLAAGEQQAVAALRQAGVTVIWSLAALEADPAVAQQLGLTLGPTHSLTEQMPVADWAQKPLAVPQMGDVALEPLQQFGSLKPGSDPWQAATSARELIGSPAWRPAVSAGGPVVVNQTDGQARQWAFGVDLQAAAVALERTTQHGKQHSIYDRATACGLERLFRVLANAMVSGAPPRPAARPRLRAELMTDRDVYGPGDPVTVRVQVRDAEGHPAAAAVRVTVPGAEYFLGNPGYQPQWVEATAVAPGLYEAHPTVPAGMAGPRDWSRGKARQMRTALIYADVAQPGWVSDWVAHVVRVGEETNEPARMALLARLVSQDLIQRQVRVEDKVQWVELTATLTMPRGVRAGVPVPLEISMDRIEDDAGNDWAEEVELVLRPVGGGAEVRLPLAPGKCFAAPRASVVKNRPQDCMVVTSTAPAQLQVIWQSPRAGQWTAALAYRYSDDFHIQDTNRLPRLDRFNGGPLEVR